MPDDIKVKTNAEAYMEFCEKHNLTPISFSEIASILHISINHLEFSIKGMIHYYPERFIELHRNNAQQIRVSN